MFFQKYWISFYFLRCRFSIIWRSKVNCIRRVNFFFFNVFIWIWAALGYDFFILEIWQILSLIFLKSLVILWFFNISHNIVIRFIFFLFLLSNDLSFVNHFAIFRIIFLILSFLFKVFVIYFRCNFQFFLFFIFFNIFIFNFDLFFIWCR